MARLARAEVFDPSKVAVLHICARVVRRSYLFGIDPVSWKNHDHRKIWIEDQLKLLAANFGIDLLSFAILSNPVTTLRYSVGFSLCSKRFLRQRTMGQQPTLSWHHLPSLTLEMVGDEGEDGVVAGLVVGLVAGNDYGEVFFGGEPGDGVPHGVAPGVGEGGTASPGLAVGDDPAHGVFRLAGGGSVELLERFGFDQFGFRRREVGGDEFGPVSDRAVDDASGTDGDGIVGAGAGLDGGAVGFVAARLVVFRGRAEAGCGHAERAEDLFTHKVFPGFARHLLGHVASDGEASVGVDELLAGSGFGRFRRDALEEQSARARGRALVLPEFAPEFILFDRTVCAAPMGEELFERDGLVLGVHGFLQLGEGLAQGLTPF